LGTAILKELLNSGLFEVTVLTRETSNHSFPSDVIVAKVDYTKLESLTEALMGQDALVSAVAEQAIPDQRLLIDAAVKAGVKRVLPSEFGCDLKNPKARALPCFVGKVQIEQYLDELAIKGAISYTLVFTGVFLDMGLRNGLFFDFKGRKADIFDGGDQLISSSRLTTAGKAVRRILTHPRETADRAVWVKDIDISQKELVKLAQALTPGEEWELKNVDTPELEKECLEQIKKKEDDAMTKYSLVKCAIFSAAYGNKFEHVHNSTLGIKGMTGPDLEELIASIFGRKRT
jgi:CRISPR/Cas system CMR-associated protein Cmr3 (group 5 of RAMP superfamily)